MDNTRTRIIAGVCGAIFGFAALIILSVSLALALTPYFGAAIATLSTALVWIFAAGICLFVCMRPYEDTSAGLDSIQTAATDALADLPFDAIEKMIVRHPLKAAGIALVVGYSLIKAPGAHIRTLQTLLIRYL